MVYFAPFPILNYFLISSDQLPNLSSPTAYREYCHKCFQFVPNFLLFAFPQLFSVLCLISLVMAKLFQYTINLCMWNKVFESPSERNVLYLKQVSSDPHLSLLSASKFMVGEGALDESYTWQSCQIQILVFRYLKYFFWAQEWKYLEIHSKSLTKRVKTPFIELTP